MKIKKIIEFLQELRSESQKRELTELEKKTVASLIALIEKYYDKENAFYKAIQAEKEKLQADKARKETVMLQLFLSIIALIQKENEKYKKLMEEMFNIIFPPKTELKHKIKM